MRLETANEQGDAWIESIAALVAQRPPAVWNDSDIAAFAISIADRGRRFRTAEEVAVATHMLPNEAPVLRIGLANGHGEVSRVIHVIPNDAAVQRRHADLRQVFGRHTQLSTDQQTAAFAAILESLLTQEQPLPHEEQSKTQ